MSSQTNASEASSANADILRWSTAILHSLKSPTCLFELAGEPHHPRRSTDSHAAVCQTTVAHETLIQTTNNRVNLVHDIRSMHPGRDLRLTDRSPKGCALNLDASSNEC